MDPIIGQIILFAGSWAPKGFAPCDGRVLKIADYQSLFSLIGTTYGGDGVNSFSVPDLRGRVPMSAGQGPGLSHYALGERAGTESVALSAQQMPSHTHALRAHEAPGVQGEPKDQMIAEQPTNAFGGMTADVDMASASIGATGGGAAHENRQPSLALNYCIALDGIYPSRN